MKRVVDWGGIHNTRDFGGLPTRAGPTRFGRLYRMPRPDILSTDGWAELESAGVRTLIDLRNPDEISKLPLRPASVRSVTCAIEDQTDHEFMALMAPFLGSPTYYAENLRRWPDKVAAVFAAIAAAPPGGIVIHCAAGRDRTGLIAALILNLCEVDLTAILDDYELGVRQTNDFLLELDDPHEDPQSDGDLAGAIVTARTTLTHLLAKLDAEQYLLGAGCSSADLDAVRARLLP